LATSIAAIIKWHFEVSANTPSLPFSPTHPKRSHDQPLPEWSAALYDAQRDCPVSDAAMSARLQLPAKTGNMHLHISPSPSS
jgi:hypothetical protein